MLRPRLVSPAVGKAVVLLWSRPLLEENATAAARPSDGAFTHCQIRLLGLFFVQKAIIILSQDQGIQ